VALRGRPILLELDTGTIDLLTLDDGCAADDHSLVGHLVAASCILDGETIVKLYRIGAPGETSAP
jgi:hypothetical protein